MDHFSECSESNDICFTVAGVNHWPSFPKVTLEVASDQTCFWIAMVTSRYLQYISLKIHN